MGGRSLESVVEANLEVERNGNREVIDPLEAISIANEPLDSRVVEEYRQRRMGKGYGIGETVGRSPEYMIEKQIEDYRDHVDNVTYRLTLKFEDGETQEYVGHPRNDMGEDHFKTRLKPSIIPFTRDADIDAADSGDEPNLIMRHQHSEVPGVVEETGFLSESSYDFSVHSAVRGDGHYFVREPDNFAYVGEPQDFIAMNGEDGLHQRMETVENGFAVTTTEHCVISMDESSNEAVSLRPYYTHVGDVGPSAEMAEKLGRWRGAQRALGRWLLDMEHEWVFNTDGSVVFYDNEIPIAVAPDLHSIQLYDEHDRVIEENIPKGEMLTDKYRSQMERGQETGRKVVNEELDVNYWDLLPRKIDSDLLGDDKKATANV
ncbi:MAG: hypothetical protein ABEJ03_01305 [Candidatus Nanohaloarchaea archaeon]